MLKITPFFPLSTKEKYTSTLDNISNSQFFCMNTSQQTFYSSHHKQKNTSDLSRLIKLATPKIINKNQTKFVETNYTFYPKHTRTRQKIQIQPIQFNKLKQIKNQKFQYDQQMEKPFSMKRSTLLKCPKIQTKSVNNRLQKDKQNIKSSISTFRKTKKCDNNLSNENQVFLKCRKLKQQKQKTVVTQKLKSSDLAIIYNSLYNRYQNMPFNELQDAEPILVNLIGAMQKQSEKQENEKYQIKKQRKSFQMKQLEFQKNLRKQIKSLTRDTDHILSLEFRDIRDINNH